MFDIMNSADSSIMIFKFSFKTVHFNTISKKTNYYFKLSFDNDIIYLFDCC